MGGSGQGDPVVPSQLFVVEDGSGKSDANAYVSVAAADTYNETVEKATAWDGADATTKERAIVRATQYVDARYGGRWVGYKGDADQALDWPRSAAVDRNGFVVASNVVPQKLKEACAYLAVRVVSGDSLLAAVASAGTVAKQAVRVGPIHKSIEYVGGKPYGPDFPKVDGLLAALVPAPGGVVRG